MKAVFAQPYLRKAPRCASDARVRASASPAEANGADTQFAGRKAETSAARNGS
jgi:hypothetical protein